ncbi:MAG: hypothetical protein EP340_09100 [Alphaproteobacteria bacterium]|nr:MAG: hypothetical protein EP340_09100 [Alphaproteobacteria bacterium]
MSEMIVLSTFGALVLAGTYGGQHYFVPQETEAPATSVERFAEQKRTLEIRPTRETCRWMAENGVEPIPAAYKAGEGSKTVAADTDRVLRETGTFEIVVAPGCEEMTTAH